jgi:hypothetical protein
VAQLPGYTVSGRRKMATPTAAASKWAMGDEASDNHQ